MIPHIPGNLEGHVHTQGWVHVHKSSEKVLSFLLLNFRVCANKKWMMRQNFKLAEWWRHVPTLMQSKAAKSGGFSGFQAFRKSFFNNYPTTKLMEQGLQWQHKTSDATLMKLIIKITKEQKLLQQASTTNPGKGEKYDFQSCCIIILKLFHFQ